MVLEKFTGGKVDLKLTEIVYDQGKSIYNEYLDGVWEKLDIMKEGVGYIMKTMMVIGLIENITIMIM